MKRMKEIYTQRIPAQLKITGGEYRAQWSGTYNYDTPILIDSLSAWKEFIKSHPEQSVNEDILQKNYGRAFFKDNVIYAYVKGESSGSIRLKVKGAELDGDKLKLSMERINPGGGTFDMATQICLFGLKRGSIKNVTVVEAIIVDKKDN